MSFSSSSMEESVKISGKKKLPAIPPNYVTLHQLQERWIKEQERKKREENGGIEKAQRGQEESEKPVEERVDGSRKDGHFRRRDRKSEKPKEKGIEAGLAAGEIEGVEKEKKGEELKSSKKKKKKKWNSKEWKSKGMMEKDEKAGVEHHGEEVVVTAANAPLPPSVEEEEEEKVVEDKANAPEQASGEARRGWKPKTITRTEDRTVEIGQSFRAMSINGGVRTKDHRRYGGRQSGCSTHRGGVFDRRREPNQRNEGRVWVKKGEVGSSFKGVD